ncbi:hypothetical protein BBJ28_00002354 [Nothophytophthora sp. Chile5]|nr:hypothetical protein BBJ28_00002354 [Nothophytophthora sp. Chile5]
MEHLENAACGRTPLWPNNDAREELRTLRGRFLRNVALWFLYGAWIFGLAFIAGLYGFSFFCMARSVLSALVGGGWASMTPLPSIVKLFVSGTVLYESYHLVTRDSLHQSSFVRNLVRQSFLQYPYFRLNVCVFEERVALQSREKQQESFSSNDTISSTSDDDDDDIDRQLAATKAVEANDVSPFVKPQDRAMFAFHPHGVLTNGWAFNGAHHMSFERADCRWLVAENLFWFPFTRDLLNWMDQGSVAKATFQRLMSSGQNVCLLPGGFEEATLYERGKHRVYIKKRFGFIKLALQHGYKVHPVYTFGEEFAYHTFPYLLSLRLKLNAFKVPGALFCGLPYCFYLPRTDLDLITVVGKPLLLPQIEHPTKAEVKKYHDQYVQALQELFDAYKGVYAVDPEAVLEIY